MGRSMGRVAGKVALITGAASGLGESIARVLALEGAKVVIADLDDARGTALAGEITKSGAHASYVHLDVTRESDWQSAMKTIVERHGKLNVLVNNAGIAPPTPLDMSFDVWRQVLSVNLDGVFLGMKYSVETMKACGEPCSIVNISSVMALVGQPTTVGYSASKGGVSALTKAGAIYCAHHKLPIRVNAVLPGTCVTPLVKGYYASRPPEELAAQVARHPIGYLGDPEDVAYGVLYLASDESKFVLGSELVIDGGLLASD
jgi:3(or 17)beta-hydroxysteroid dehydrogenase